MFQQAKISKNYSIVIVPNVQRNGGGGDPCRGKQRKLFLPKKNREFCLLNFLILKISCIEDHRRRGVSWICTIVQLFE